MNKVRRCHNAKRPRCKCWCGGFFHGANGAANREALAQGVNGILEQAGFKQGETAYIEQTKLPLEEEKDEVPSVS